MRNLLCTIALIAGVVVISEQASAQAQPKPATEATKAANEAVLKSLPFGNKSGLRGREARSDRAARHLTIKNEKGDVVWDMEQYKTYIGDDKPAPDTVNPSLWRNAQLNMHYGLFKVADRIYQVRGYDLSNITFIQGDTGWIVLDPLISAETAKAAYDLVTREPRQEADCRGDLQPLACRPLRRCTRHCRRGGRQSRQSQDPRAGKFHRARDQRERHRRQRDEPARDLHVRRVAAAQCPRAA